LGNPHLLTEKGKSEWIDKIPEENRNKILDMPKSEFFKSYLMLRGQYLRNTEQTNPAEG